MRGSMDLYFPSTGQQRIDSRMGRLGIGFALVCVLLALGTAQNSQAQTYNVLHSFANNGQDGGAPLGPLVRDRAGNLYGTTLGGGVAQAGTIYMIAPTRQETVLYEFGGEPDGRQPQGGVTIDSAGNLYGTTFYGGTHNFGTVFELNSSGVYLVLYDFTGGTDGGYPASTLLVDSSGNLYGTTTAGGDLSCNLYGTAGCGTVFKLSPTGKERVLYSFTGGADGGLPAAGLVRDSQGHLYGTTEAGGDLGCVDSSNGCGTVFELTRSGQESVLYAFAGGSDGAFPSAGVLRTSTGVIYGTTPNGGASGFGTVFEISAGTETLLHSFTGGADGATPIAGLVEDSAGNLYGTAIDAGAYGGGVAFQLDPVGTLAVLHAFNSKIHAYDGSGPGGPLLLDAAGSLYGTAEGGGADNGGVLFKIAM